MTLVTPARRETRKKRGSGKEDKPKSAAQAAKEIVVWVCEQYPFLEPEAIALVFTGINRYFRGQRSGSSEAKQIEAILWAFKECYEYHGHFFADVSLVNGNLFNLKMVGPTLPDHPTDPRLSNQLLILIPRSLFPTTAVSRTRIRSSASLHQEI